MNGYVLTRRAFLASSAMVAAGLMVAPGALASELLRFRIGLESAGGQDLMEGLAPAFQKALGWPVRVIAFRIDEEGRWPVEVVYDAPPDAMEVLVAAVPYLISVQTYSTKDVDPMRLTKIGRLTKGESYAVVGPRAAPGQGLDAIRGLASHKPLMIAVPNTAGGFGLFATLIARKSGIQPDMLDVISTPEALADVSRGKAQLAAVLTRSFVSQSSAWPNLRILLISDKARAPEFPQVPTLAEVTGVPGLSLTSSLGLFGPPDMPAATVARISQAIRQAANDPASQAAATKTGYRLDPGGPAELAADYAQDERVLKDILVRPSGSS